MRRMLTAVAATAALLLPGGPLPAAGTASAEAAAGQWSAREAAAFWTAERMASALPVPDPPADPPAGSAAPEPAAPDTSAPDGLTAGTPAGPGPAGAAPGAADPAAGTPAPAAPVPAEEAPVGQDPAAGTPAGQVPESGQAATGQAPAGQVPAADVPAGPAPVPAPGAEPPVAGNAGPQEPAAPASTPAPAGEPAPPGPAPAVPEAGTGVPAATGAPAAPPSPAGSPAPAAPDVPVLPGAPATPSAPVTPTGPALPTPVPAPVPAPADTVPAPAPRPVRPVPKPTPKPVAAPIPASARAGVGKDFDGSPAVGRMFVMKGGGAYFCTASVVSSPGRNLVLSAAHCLLGPDSRQVAFVPRYTKAKPQPYGMFPVLRDAAGRPKMWIDPRYRREGADRAATLDAAFAQVGPNARRTAVETAVGGNRLVTGATFAHARVTLIGYPSSAARPRVCFNRTTKFTSRDAKIPGSFLRIACTGYPGGTSGGPFLTRYDQRTGTGDVVGVIGGWKTGGTHPDTSYSAYFGAQIRKLYQAAVAGARVG
ncbi:trypsin-like peptidase domain-containing protein [Streptomyces sp. NPDC006512]|uniref:trypsin-like peptidase domain-containing protein n=1 Tax=Streptomyces sp. NPDC006512 TaxID=3154307 RepID=UPI0033A19CD3